MEKIIGLADLEELGKKLGKFVVEGEVIALIGDLGVGKTTLSKNFGMGLEIDERMKSPTFNYVLEYRSGRLPLYHFDVYRLSDPSELYDLGYDDYIDGSGVLLIEWADIVLEELPKKYIELVLSHNDENSRVISLKYIGDKKREEEMYNYVGFRN